VSYGVFYCGALPTGSFAEPPTVAGAGAAGNNGESDTTRGVPGEAGQLATQASACSMWL
jgi:hypothetical protein